MNASEPREDAVAVLPPIDRDEELDRDYIPLPGGWEIQTKGKGSTFRICDAKGDRLAIPDSPYLHETLTRMAREVHAAAIAALAQQGAEPVAWQFKGDDGKWYAFTNDQHRDNTIADGRWEIRALCVCHCAAQPGAPR